MGQENPLHNFARRPARARRREIRGQRLTFCDALEELFREDLDCGTHIVGLFFMARSNAIMGEFAGGGECRAGEEGAQG